MCSRWYVWYHYSSIQFAIITILANCITTVQIDTENIIQAQLSRAPAYVP